MAHTSDRTLLAALGFQDPDKRDKRHTLACQYLCQPEIATRMWERLFPGCTGPRPAVEPVEVPTGGDHSIRTHRFPSGRFELVHRDAQTEVGIYKGRGFLVGFWDVCLGAQSVSGGWSSPACVWQPREFFSTHMNGGTVSSWGNVHVAWRYEPEWGPTYPDYPLHIEVKVAPVDVAAIARQIDLYRAFTEGTSGIVVATCYQMTAADKATLAAKAIRHVYLGEGFKAYCARREAEVAEEEPGL